MCQPGRPTPNGVDQRASSDRCPWGPSTGRNHVGRACRGDVGRVDRIVLVGTGGVHGRAHAVGHGSGLIDFGSLLLVGEFAVMRPGCHIEVHVAGGLAVRIRDHIAVAVVENALNQVDHVRHVAGGARFHGGRQHAERVVRLGEFALVVIGAGPPTLAGGRGLIEDLVVDIGHITHKSDFVTELQNQRRTMSNATAARIWPICGDDCTVAPHT